jgi:hypothetical protein
MMQLNCSTVTLHRSRAALTNVTLKFVGADSETSHALDIAFGFEDESSRSLP